jgi:integrase
MKTAAQNTTGLRSTYSVIFYMKKAVRKKNGLCPVMGRITIDGDSRAFSLRIDGNPNLWDAATNRMTGKSSQSLAINRSIEKYKEKIDGFYNDILYGQGYLTAEIIKNVLEGRGKKETGLMKLFHEHNEEFRLRIGIDTTKVTYITYLRTYKWLTEFLKYKYNAEDIMMQCLTLSFIEDFDFYLRHTRNMSNKTIFEAMIKLKKIIKRAIKQGTLKQNPFFGYNNREPEEVYRYLEPEELERIMQTPIASKSLCHTRDMFVFSCFTGLSYADLRRLSEKHIKTGDNGRMWISIERQKCKTKCHIPLMKLPLQIIEKYRASRVSEKLFKTICSESLAVQFRKLENLCNVKHITFHKARHTFATQILLSGGVSIASISKILGHTKAKTTQIYAKVTCKKVNEEMKILSDRMKGKYTLPENRILEKALNQ